VSITASNEASHLTVEAPPALPITRDATRFDAPGTFRLLGNVYVIGQFQGDIARSPADFAPSCRLKAGISYTTIGDVQIVDPRNSSAEFGWPAMHWDTELRVQRPLTTFGIFDVSLVGEALNLLDLNKTDTTPKAETLSSPTIRAEGLIEF